MTVMVVVGGGRRGRTMDFSASIYVHRLSHFQIIYSNTRSIVIRCEQNICSNIYILHHLKVVTRFELENMVFEGKKSTGSSLVCRSSILYDPPVAKGLAHKSIATPDHIDLYY